MTTIVLTMLGICQHSSAMPRTAAAALSLHPAALGSKLRRCRKELKQALEAAVKTPEVTTGFVNQVGHNITPQPLASLTTEAEALDAHIPGVCDPRPKPDQTRRARMRDVQTSPGRGFVLKRMSTAFPDNMVNLLLVLSSAHTQVEDMSRDGEDLCDVIDETRAIKIDSACTTLGMGESIHLNGSPSFHHERSRQPRHRAAHQHNFAV